MRKVAAFSLIRSWEATGIGLGVEGEGAGAGVRFGGRGMS